MSGKIISDYRIFTDATADFCPSLLQGLPRIEIIPMSVTLDDVQYLYGPGGNLTTDRSMPYSVRVSLPPQRRSILKDTARRLKRR